MDRLAVKRGWSLSWPYLDPTTAAYLDALHLGMVPGPLWLLDPERPNRFHGRIAATGSVDRTTAGFAATSGALTWSTAVPPIGVPVAGGLDWAATATGGNLYTADGIPVVPGEPVVFSAFVASATVPVRLLIALYNAANTFVSSAESAPAIPGSGGQRLTVSHTPAAPSAIARGFLAASNSDAGGRISTAGWQLEPGTTPSDWSPGGGAAVVVLDALSTAYPVPGSRAATLTLLEV